VEGATCALDMADAQIDPEVQDTSCSEPLARMLLTREDMLYVAGAAELTIFVERVGGWLLAPRHIDERALERQTDPPSLSRNIV
jgi:hypothetical protein